MVDFTSPGQHSYDASGEDVTEVEIWGAGGGGASESAGGIPGDGGPGGYIKLYVDTAGTSTLDVWVGGGGGGADEASSTQGIGGTGRFDGGDGGTTNDEWGGGGGGSSEVLFTDGTFIAAGDAGGGGGDDNAGAGGGARGGSGTQSGTDGGGTGYGGDGGSFNEDGYPGGTEAGSTSKIIEVETQSTGGGNSGGASTGSSAAEDGADGKISLTDGQIELDAPSNLSASAVDKDQIDLSWTDTNDDNDEHRIYRDTSSGVATTSENRIATVGASAESYSDTGLDDGAEYFYVVTAYVADDRTGSSDESDPSNEGSDVTDLPAPSGVSASGSTSGIDVSWTLNTTDEAEVRLYREQSSGIDTSGSPDATFAAGTESYSDTVSEGGDYYYRITVWTSDFGESADSNEASGTYPRPSNVAATNVGETSLDVTWSDNALSNDSYEIDRMRDDYGTWTTIASALAADTSSYTDSTVQPERTYSYRVRAVFADGTLEADSDPVTTASLGIPQTRTRRQQWTLEVDHPVGDVLRPTVSGDVTFSPRVNDLPRLQTSLAISTPYRSETLLEQPLRAWYRGTQLPIDTVRRLGDEPGQLTLEADGGRQLRQLVEVELSDDLVHEAMESLIQTETDYVADVDDPSTNTTEDTTLREVSTTGEFESQVENSGDVELDIANGTLATARSGWFLEATSMSGTYTEVSGSDDYNDKRAARLDTSTDRVEESISIRDINPGDGGAIRISVRIDARGSGDHHPMSIVWDGTTVETIGAGQLTNAINWFDVFITGESADTYRVEVQCDDTQNSDFPPKIDVVWVGDDQFSYNFPSSPTVTNDGTYLDGPEEYPDEYLATFVENPQPQRIESATLEATGAYAGNGFARLGISEDGGGTWYDDTDTTSTSRTYQSDSTSETIRIGLGRRGERDTEGPRLGYQPAVVETATVTGNLDDTPILSEGTFEGQLREVLTQLADFGNFVWEYRLVDGQETVSVTQPGTRPSSVDPSLASYTLERHVDELVERAIVYGASKRRVRETVTATHGTWVSLDRERLTEGKESVYDPTTDTSFTEGEDYEIRYLTGELKTLSGGAMTDGDSYRIDYAHRTRGEYSTGVSDPATVVEQIPDLSTDQACEQAALYLVQRASEPRHEVDVEIPATNRLLSAIEAIDPARLPGDGPYQMRDATVSASGQSIRLASRQSTSEIIDEIRSQLASTSRQV